MYIFCYLVTIFKVLRWLLAMQCPPTPPLPHTLLNRRLCTIDLYSRPLPTFILHFKEYFRNLEIFLIILTFFRLFWCGEEQVGQEYSW